MKQKDPLLIIDGYGFIFRAYHVQPPLTSPKGDPVGAIYGFTSMLLKVLMDFNPKYAVIVLDHEGTNFRHDLYNNYKANRPPISDDLKHQLKMIQEAAKALNFACLSKQGYEADDIIATIARKFETQNHPAIIISGDKDLMQLTGKNIKLYDPVKYKYIEENDIINKFGVGADKVREVQALIGDKSDNIPGIPGIGPKTASQLIREYGDLRGILNSINKLSPRHQQLFTDYKEDALLSWKLVGLNEKVEINAELADFIWTATSTEKLSNFINENGFKSLHKRIETLFNLKILPNTDADHTSPKPLTTKAKIRISEINQLDDFTKFIEKTGVFAFDVRDNLFVIYDGRNIYEIELGVELKYQEDIFSYAENKSDHTTIQDKLYELISDLSIKKIVWDAKNLEKILNYEIKAAEDIMIMDYVLNAGNKDRTINDILGRDIGEDTICGYIECYNLLVQELIKQKHLHLYKDIDLPLYPILKNMENEGINVNIPYLQQLSTELEHKITKLEQMIHLEAGREFNIASPKQLGVILFEELKLPFGKLQTKSQSYTTNVDILEKLKLAGHKIADLLLEYRHLSKLKNTYIDSLPKQVDQNSRVHTTFMQCLTSTSRLSSVNPNLQNIPIRTLEGEKVRAAFTAKAGYKLISADYSQIELRILSYVANINSLKESFKHGIDVHTHTASQIFKIPIKDITPEIRRKAKAINFGIIYGISSFGLANQLNIGQKAASEYIRLYFNEYPGIEKYMNDTIEFAKQNGFVTNLLGRKFFLPAINDKNHALRSFAQRAAINAPMQGLAADIVKIAMINCADLINKQNFKTKMILQVHDELIFEAPEDEVNIVMPLIKSAMEEPIKTKTDILHLKVDIKSGNSWYDVH
ncbi:MAG: DNA polymerase I [Rickettsiaceae bacterium]|nr:DNA polymerase I [Rickettsiaceae bacterium]